MIHRRFAYRNCVWPLTHLPRPDRFSREAYPWPYTNGPYTKDRVKSIHGWATAGGAAESKLVISGRYEDTLKRDDGTWRFVTRKMIPDS